MIAWSSTWTHVRKDFRQSGSSIDTIGGTKLIKNWTLGPATVPTGQETAAVIYKNLAFYSVGNTLYALDTVPQEDLDGDGNPDDGIPNSSPNLHFSNQGQDVVWMWPTPGQGTGQGDGSELSPPTIATILNPSNLSQSWDVVFVTSAAGNVYMMDAFPTNAAGILQPSTTAVPVISGMSGMPDSSGTHPYPPLYVNGWVYATSSDGHLYASNPALQYWLSNSNASSTQKAGISAQWVKPQIPSAIPGSTSSDTSGSARL